MKDEQQLEQNTQIINQNLVCDVLTGKETDVNNQMTMFLTVLVIILLIIAIGYYVYLSYLQKA